MNHIHSQWASSDVGSALQQGRNAQRATQTQKKRGQKSMPRMGFEPTTPVSERAKTFLTLDRTATVIVYLRYEI
jgi:hypothetical protein